MKRATILSAAFILSAGSGLALAQSATPKAEQPTEAAAPKAEPKVEKLAVGDKAPALMVEKWMKGQPVTGFEKGKVYIVEFWATWCGPCIRAMPHLTDLQKEFGPKGLTIIGVSSKDSRGNTLERAEKMVADKGETVGYTMAWDTERRTNSAYMEASGQDGIPCSFVVDQDGKVAYIGHPSELDIVLPMVMEKKWDIRKGPEAIEAAQEMQQEIMMKAQDDPKGAMKDLKAFEARYPRLAKKMGAARADLMIKTDDPDAYKVAGPVVDEAIAKKDPQTLNQLAWAIVDPKGTTTKRDLDVALKAATEADKLTQGKNAAIVDTLARVHWLKGDKAKAVELQEKAVKLAGDDDEDLKAELEANLKEYKAGGKS